jgi:diacylglycerol kinase family enzyme
VPGFLLANPRSGKDRPGVDELHEAAAAHGVHVHVLGPDEHAQEVARSAEASALGVAGGDGSLAPIAGIAIERGLPFVCIPFGTRNHFARDLGLDRNDPIGALAAFSGEERRVDVGRIGARVFLNNVSLGLYAGLIHRRERHRRRGQALAALRAVWRVARARPGVLPLSVDGEALVARALLVASNAYSLNLFSLGERERLDEGLLHLYAAAGLLPTSWEEPRSGAGFTVDSPHSPVRAAIDGEPAELETPLEFTIDPGALRVLLPPATG